MASSVDTIAALATPAGTSALAVVRTSGPLSAPVAQAIFGAPSRPGQTRRGDYSDRAGALVDDVLHSFFQAPNSYTGEDLLEISCHGNPFIVQRILEDLYARGCRPAEPGEYTRRAFLNGRMDLSQAEAVVDLIHAHSDRALAAANRQLRGVLGEHLMKLTARLVDLLARVEAHIDFPDEDLPPERRDDLRTALERLLADTEHLLATRHYGAILRDGIKTVILGEPNSGKSSLLNRLVGHERALVSAEPGTTRDYLEERLTLGSHCIRLIDTAGINGSPTPLEELGMRQTVKRAAEADLILLVVDVTRPPPSLPDDIRGRLTAANSLVVANKIDLRPAGNFAPPEHLPAVRVSALTGAGCDGLVAAIVRHAESFRGEQNEELIAINARHAHALSQAIDRLKAAIAGIGAAAPAELLASDLRYALDCLGEISGRIDNEQVLDRLFATFCIGK